LRERRIIVHSLDHARAAAAAGEAIGVTVTAMSARGIASFLGVGWFKAAINRAAADHPAARLEAVIDCADEPGTVLAALRVGLKRISFTGAEETRLRLDEIARQLGASVEGAVEFAALDLIDSRDPLGAARAFLAAD
jgi:hypothetical protein